MLDTLLYYGNIALAIYKALAVIVIVFSVAGFAYVVIKKSETRHIKSPQSLPDTNLLSIRTGNVTTPSAQQLTTLKDTTITRWHQIVEQLGTEDQKNFKSAIIEADALADIALRAHGFEGDTMADRMQTVPRGQFTGMEDFWRAHKVRNAIAHDPHYIVSPREGHDIMRIYKKMLEELGAL
jgi:hypothetical protein